MSLTKEFILDCLKHAKTNYIDSNSRIFEKKKILHFFETNNALKYNDKPEIDWFMPIAENRKDLKELLFLRKLVNADDQKTALEEAKKELIAFDPIQIVKIILGYSKIYIKEGFSYRLSLIQGFAFVHFGGDYTKVTESFSEFNKVLGLRYQVLEELMSFIFEREAKMKNQEVADFILAQVCYKSDYSWYDTYDDYTAFWRYYKDSDVAKLLELYYEEGLIPVNETSIKFFKQVRDGNRYDNNIGNKLKAFAVNFLRKAGLRSIFEGDYFLEEMNGMITEENIGVVIDFVNSLKLAGSATTMTAKSEKTIMTAIRNNELVKDFFAKISQSVFEIVIQSMKAPGKLTHDYVYTYIPFRDYSVDVIKSIMGILGKKELAEELDFETERVANGLYTLIQTNLKTRNADKLMNSAIRSLGSLATDEAAAKLATLLGKVKKVNEKSLVSKALDNIAILRGITKDELRDMTASDYEFGYGKKEISKNGYMISLHISPMRKVEMEIKDEKGKIYKKEPETIKEFVKSLKKENKEIEKYLTIQKGFYDSMYLQYRIFDYQNWVRYHFGHGLNSCLCRKLVWQFEDDKGNKETGIYSLNKETGKSQLVNYDNEVINLDITVCKIKLWHPLFSSSEIVSKWQDFILTNEIIQPFKQAFREVYRVNEEEKILAQHSNRFAAHIINQQQFKQLCDIKNWSYRIMGWWDDGYDDGDTVRKINEIYSASLHVESLDYNSYDDTTNSGAMKFIGTDRVTFYKNGLVLPVAEVDPFIFSEIMREVDMLVSVSSVGANEEWIEGRMNSYWYKYNFGDLTVSGEARLELLKKLVPKLKIRDKVNFTKDSLIVHGKRFDYQIHCNNGGVNILPTQKYLCIVKGNKKGDGTIFLPFEGDETTSFIISKAFLLAEDDKIKDQVILNQLNSVK
jgi:Domain of unknown function (DUF4132)